MAKRDDKLITFAKGRLFNPFTVRRFSGSGTGGIRNFTAGKLTASIEQTTSSFQYDAPGTGVKSTQQLQLDFSKFENHVFFSSAEVKVNESFERIINQFPFDGKRDEVLNYFNSLTGFEKYIYDIFPKNTGFVNFDTSLDNAIVVKDVAGVANPRLARLRDGSSVLDPREKSFTIEMYIRPGKNANTENQVVMQQLDSTKKRGYTLFLSESLQAANNVKLEFLLSSGSLAISSSMNIAKENFQHVAIVFRRDIEPPTIEMWKEGVLQSKSTDNVEFSSMDLIGSSILIGSGTTHNATPTKSVTNPIQFSGSLDELRLYHRAQGPKHFRKYKDMNVYSEDSLRLYMKFNEPTGSYTSKNLALDHSGNSLHSTIQNYVDANRVKGIIETPVKSEELNLNPVLFPTYPDLVTLNSNLLHSASSYDSNNPNLITKLVPKHYFLEASSFEGFDPDKEFGNMNDPYGYSSDVPGGGKLGQPHIVASILFMWSKFFDEMKQFVDQFGDVLTPDYFATNTTPDQFLPFVASRKGFHLPDFFANSNLRQWLAGANLTTSVGVQQNSLFYIQNVIWRRILTELPEVIQSKGTIHSIKSLMRSVGIQPDQNFRFREFGGSRTRMLSVDVREERTEVSTLLDMSGTFNPQGTLNHHGLDSNRPYIKSPFLRTRYKNLAGSTLPRIEPGYPFTHKTSSLTDSLLTSGSWTYEAIYQFPKRTVSSYFSTQSLVRLHLTGTDAASSKHGVVLNLCAVSSSLFSNTTGSLTLNVRPEFGTTKKVLVLPMTGVNLFDGNKWHISFGRIRRDQFNSIASSSYFLRAATVDRGRIFEAYSASVGFNDFTELYANIFENGVSSRTKVNSEGPFFMIGSQSISGNGNFLNSKDEFRKSTTFQGKVGHIRWWSKALSGQETIEHAKNFKSLGVLDPTKNFNFVTNKSGSFERLRIDASTDQIVTNSNAQGSLEIFDFSQNNFHMTGANFEPNKSIIRPERFVYSMLTSRFDENKSSDLVRVRSLQKIEGLQDVDSPQLAPVFRTPPGEEPSADRRFSLEISSVQALNEDIINILSSLESFDNFLGEPNNVFAGSYKDLAHMRSIYFNRLEDKVNIKNFFEFFRWFDGTISDMVDSLVPRKTNYLGSNFVIEGHVLERSKVRHMNANIYLAPNDRHGLQDSLLLQQLVGAFRRI